MDVLEAVNHTSLINPNVISDAQLVEELKKYKNAQKGILNFYLMSEDMGRNKFYLFGLFNRIKNGHSLQDETRDQIISYLSKKGWFTPGGLPKDYRDPYNAAKPSLSFETKIIASDLKDETDFESMTDLELKQRILEWQKANGKQNKFIAKILGIKQQSFYQFFHAYLESKMKPHIRRNIIGFFNEESGIKTPNERENAMIGKMLGSTIQDAVEKVKERTGHLSRIRKAYIMKGILEQPIPEEEKASILDCLAF